MCPLELTSALASNYVSSHLSIVDHDKSQKAHKILISHKVSRKPFKPHHRSHFPNLNPNLKPNPSKLPFSKSTINSILHTLKNTWSPSTFSAYSRSINLFISFCDKEKIPIRARLPANEYLLCAFAASKAGHLSGKTIQNHLTALKAWHHIHNVEWKGSAYLRLVMRGTNNLTPVSSKKPPRPPIDYEMLKKLIQLLDLNKPFDAVVAACASTAFWGESRLGELLGSSRTRFNTISIPARINLHHQKNRNSSYVLHIPHTKTSHHSEDIILVQQTGITNPLHLLKHHLKINSFASSLPLFCYQSPKGLYALTKRSFLARCNTIWLSLGYPSVTGHSFRIRGTTELLLAGVPPDIVKTMGRWKSDSFLRYWRHLEKVASLHAKIKRPSGKLHGRNVYVCDGFIYHVAGSKLAQCNRDGIFLSHLLLLVSGI